VTSCLELRHGAAAARVGPCNDFIVITKSGNGIGPVKLLEVVFMVLKLPLVLNEKHLMQVSEKEVFRKNNGAKQRRRVERRILNNKNICEDDCPLNCCVVQSRSNYPMFRRCLLPPSKGQSSSP
jgi:hypothetical protein